MLLNNHNDKTRVILKNKKRTKMEMTNLNHSFIPDDGEEADSLLQHPEAENGDINEFTSDDVEQFKNSVEKGRFIILAMGILCFVVAIFLAWNSFWRYNTLNKYTEPISVEELVRSNKKFIISTINPSLFRFKAFLNVITNIFVQNRTNIDIFLFFTGFTSTNAVG